MSKMRQVEQNKQSEHMLTVLGMFFIFANAHLVPAATTVQIPVLTVQPWARKFGLFVLYPASLRKCLARSAQLGDKFPLE